MAENGSNIKLFLLRDWVDGKRRQEIDRLRMISAEIAEGGTR